MTIGGLKKANHLLDSEIQSVSYKSGVQFTVHLDRVEVDGEKLDVSSSALNSGQGAFFDSGTTSFHGPSRFIE